MDSLNISHEKKLLDPKGEKLLQCWLNFSCCSEVDVTNFKKLIKHTMAYFSKLNNNENVALSSGDEISFHSCMRIVSVINEYSKNKAITADEDLRSNLELTKQITLKATKLVAESLVFALSLVPKFPLGNSFGVIYNGETINYDVMSGNMEDITIAVGKNPYSDC